MQFGHDLPCIIQVIWEDYLAKGPVRMSKLDVTDAYHRGTLRPSQVGTFAYVIPLTPDDDGIIICINLVLLIGWMDPPNFFCTFSEILTDVANALIDTARTVPEYGTIAKIPATGPGTPDAQESLIHIDCYVDDIISAVQGTPE